MILEVKNISRDFQQSTVLIPAVQNITFSMEEKETLAIVGPSGSGKTTLLSLLAGLDAPTKGTIDIYGHRITSMTERELSRFRAHHIGIVFQQFHLMPHLTAEENIRLPLEILGKAAMGKNHSIGENHSISKNSISENATASGGEGKTSIGEKVYEVLSKVGLLDRRTHMPHQLSGGENQRVAIARALVAQPKILLADEPSGNLDTRTGTKVMDLLFALVEDHSMTMVLVSHDEGFAARCKRKIEMRAGRTL